MTARLYVLDDYRLPKRPTVRRFSKPLKERGVFPRPDFTKRLPPTGRGRDAPQQDRIPALLHCEIQLPSPAVDQRIPRPTRTDR